MPYARGTRDTAGGGTAIATAGDDERIRIGDFIQLQIKETGPVDVLLKLGSTTHYSVLMQAPPDGVILVSIPRMTGERGEDMTLDLSSSVEVGYQIWYDLLK